jgi:hypothetical protein
LVIFSGSVVDKPNRDRFNTQLDRQHKRPVEHQAQVAQLVEQRTENPRVGGSIPPLGTKYQVFRRASVRVFLCLDAYLHPEVVPLFEQLGGSN